MSTRWRCAVCEGVNEGGRTCSTCGAALGRTAALSRDLRGEVARRAPGVPVERARAAVRAALPPTAAVVERAEWEAERGFDVRPLPGGCLLTFGGAGGRGPGRRRRFGI